MKPAVLKKYSNRGYEYIFIYWKHKGSLIKINTGNKYIAGWMRKNLLYNHKHPDQEKVNAETEGLLRKVNNYINNQVEQGHIPNQRELKAYLDGKPLGRSKRRSAGSKKTPVTLQDWYDVFLEYKKSQLQSRLSYKDYISLNNTLKDYQETNGKLILEAVDSVGFFPKFTDFLVARGLNNNTINKRIQSFQTFLRYLQGEEIYRFRPSVFEYKIKKYQPVSVILSESEIDKLADLEVKEDYQQKILDVFIMNCYLGLRYADLETLNSGEFIQDGEFLIYRKVNQKTKTEIEVPIFGRAKEILEKYDFNPPIPANQYFNRTLKDILKEHELFEDLVVTRRYVKGAETIERVPKRELISSHTCRRTFVTTALANNIPINLLQTATGHKQIGTLNKYVKRNRDFSQFQRLHKKRAGE